MKSQIILTIEVDEERNVLCMRGYDKAGRFSHFRSCSYQTPEMKCRIFGPLATIDSNCYRHPMCIGD